MQSRIYALTDEAVGLHAQLKSKTLTHSERKTLAESLEETLALKTSLEIEFAKQMFLQDVPWTAEELDCPPESKLMRGPAGAGGGLRRRSRE